MKKSNLSKIFYYLILIAVLIFTLLPIVYTICSSFKTDAEVLVSPESILPSKISFENYKKAWNADDFNVGRLLWNSTWYTLISVAMAIAFSAVEGYIFARGEFKGKNTLFAVRTTLMFVAMGSITIYPTFEVLNLFGLSGNLWGLIVRKFFGVSIVHVLLVRSFVNSLPHGIEEAAYIDGCSFMGAFFRVILPLLKPIIATIGILAFKANWNEYLMPALFTLTRPEQRTLIVAVTELKSSDAAAASWGLMLAGSTIAMVPVLIAYTFANKYFVSGLAAGAVKG